MRFLKQYIIAAFYAVFALLGACTLSEEPVVPPAQESDSKKYLNLLLNVSTLESSPRSRAISDNLGDYSFEAPIYSTEKLQSLRVIIVKEKTGDIVHNYFISLNEPGDHLNDLIFKVEFSTEYNVYLIGNESGLDPEVKERLATMNPGMKYPVNCLESITIGGESIAPYIDNESGSTLIPMTEKFEITTRSLSDFQFDSDNFTATMRKDLFLTRAGSKFTFNFFKFAGYDGNVEIEKVKITGLGQKQYLIPNEMEYYPSKYSAANDRLITSFAVPEDNEIGEYEFSLPSTCRKVSDFPVRGTASTVTFSPKAYFTESVGNPGENKFQVSVYVKGLGYRPMVTLNNLPSLPRNMHVIVNLTCDVDGRFSYTVDIQPYTEVILDPEFGL